MQQTVYQEGQTFKEFVYANQKRFDELFKREAQSTFEYMKTLEEDSDPTPIFQSVHKVVELLLDDRQHELVLYAKERGKHGATLDDPLVYILELIHSVRKVYWEFLFQYYGNLEIDQDELFKVERKTNDALDTFINHYFASYTEFKDELLRSQREMIDELTVPVIPLSSNMAVLPIVGTMDTYRAKKIQERVLIQISDLKISRVIIDLSGVAYMDTAVVGHLFRIVEGIALLGCKAVLTGIRPEIANTMIEMGITITERVATKGTLQQALEDYGL